MDQTAKLSHLAVVSESELQKKIKMTRISIMIYINDTMYHFGKIFSST